MSNLDLLASNVAPGDLADEFTSPSGVLLSPSHVTPGVLAQSCHPWSSRRRIYKSQRGIAFAQSSHSWISCPVISLLQLLSSRVNPAVLASEFLISSGVCLSPSRLTLGSFAQSCHSWSFAQACHSWNSCRRISDLQRRIVFAQSCHSWISWPVKSLLELLPSHVTPGDLAVSCHSRRSCRRFSNLQRRTAFTQSCHSWISCPFMSLLELSPSRVTPGALAQSCQS